MDPKSAFVKPKRPYDSARRREQARQTRAAILDIARRRFLDDGFAPTTIAVIADDAQVSVDTIYKVFGGKPGLVNAICQEALTGEGPVPAEVRSDAIQATSATPAKSSAAGASSPPRSLPGSLPSCSWYAPQRQQIPKWHASNPASTRSAWSE